MLIEGYNEGGSGRRLTLEDALLPTSTPAMIFTVMRQWAPATQQSIDKLVAAMLSRGVGPNDVDAVSGSTMLHMACKAGAEGLNARQAALRAMALLMEVGPDLNVRTTFTDMTPLHCAAFFGFDAGIRMLVDRGGSFIDLDANCGSLEGATALHLATLAASEPSVLHLLGAGANRRSVDVHGRTPYDVAQSMLSQTDPSNPKAAAWPRLAPLLDPNSNRSAGASLSTPTSTRKPAQPQPASYDAADAYTTPIRTNSVSSTASSRSARSAVTETLRATAVSAISRSTAAPSSPYRSAARAAAVYSPAVDSPAPPVPTTSPPSSVRPLRPSGQLPRGSTPAFGSSSQRMFGFSFATPTRESMARREKGYAAVPPEPSTARPVSPGPSEEELLLQRLMRGTTASAARVNAIAEESATRELEKTTPWRPAGATALPPTPPPPPPTPPPQARTPPSMRRSSSTSSSRASSARGSASKSLARTTSAGALPGTPTAGQRSMMPSKSTTTAPAWGRAARAPPQPQRPQRQHQQVVQPPPAGGSRIPMTASRRQTLAGGTFNTYEPPRAAASASQSRRTSLASSSSRFSAAAGKSAAGPVTSKSGVSVAGRYTMTASRTVTATSTAPSRTSTARSGTASSRAAAVSVPSSMAMSTKAVPATTSRSGFATNRTAPSSVVSSTARPKAAAPVFVPSTASRSSKVAPQPVTTTATSHRTTDSTTSTVDRRATLAGRSSAAPTAPATPPTPSIFTVAAKAALARQQLAEATARTMAVNTSDLMDEREVFEEPDEQEQKLLDRQHHAQQPQVPRIPPREIGDRVVVIATGLRGTLRFLGEVHFKPGRWAGVQLDLPKGKHDGSVDGKIYFHCHAPYGLLVAVEQVRLLTPEDLAASPAPVPVKKHAPILPPLNETPKKRTRMLRRDSVQLGSRVMVERTVGVLRYVGEPDFAKGLYVGVELQLPVGEHDGKVDGIRYFTCPMGHGVLVPAEKATCRGIRLDQLIKF